MACKDISAALPQPAHPMANPGYGKRSAPDQLPARAGAFDHLRAREAYIAGYLDRLPDGAAMDAKTLAKALPLVGQMAVRTSLNRLSEAGHLRRVRRNMRAEDGGTATRWVFHTYWSRTARDSEWWAGLVEGDGTPATGSAQQPTPSTAPQPDAPQSAPTAPADVADAVPKAKAKAKETAALGPSPAYTALAQLGGEEPRLTLSAADCAALEGLAAEWLARGADTAHLVRSLVAGLPEQVHSPRALVQRRLRDKMPPELAVLPAPLRTAAAPAPRRTLMECTDCRVPGRPEALPGGLCRACRNTNEAANAHSDTAPPTSARTATVPSTADVRLRIDELRSTLRQPCRV